MKNSKAVYVTKRDLRAYNRNYELYSNRVVKVDDRDSDEDYEVYKDFSCQYDNKIDNVICTCRRVNHRSLRYFRSPRQIYTTQERYPGWKSFTDIGVGIVKTLPRRRTKRIYLPETDDRGVGNSDYSLFFEQKKRHYETSYYEQKRTSSKCVGGLIETINASLISQKLSPIIQTQSCSTSPIDLTAASKQLVKSTDTYKINKNIVAHIECNSKRNSKTEQCLKKEREYTKSRPQENTTKTEAVQKTGLKSVETYTEKTEKDFSSDSLVQHVHNLENPSFDKQTDPMENKLEREYRKMFTPKEDSQVNKQNTDKPVSDLKSASILRRRFEALRKGLCKKEDSKKDIVIAKESSQQSFHSRKDVSIASDPPSLEPKSYSNTKIYSPYTSFTRAYKYVNSPVVAKKISSKKKNELNTNWSTDIIDSDYNGVKGMFKLWGKKFNFEEENGKQSSSPKPSACATVKSEKKIEKIVPEKVVEEKKGGKRFFFFGKRSKDKAKPVFKAKKGVTAGRCEVEDGLTIKIGAKEYPAKIPEHIDSTIDNNDNILRKSWLRNFLTSEVDSKRSVQVRWNSNLYATSSTTVFELLDCVYKNTGLVIRSKSDTTTAESSNYYAPKNHAVKFMQKDIQAWMIPKTIYPHYQSLNESRDDDIRNIQVRYSDKKWYIDKSQCGNKIEVVLHSKNFIKTGKSTSSEYILIDIPKGYFTDSATLNNDRSSDEEVYKITDYESNSFSFKRNKVNLDTGDHVSNQVQVAVNTKDEVEIFETAVKETAIGAPPLYRDVTVQGSQVCIGVGIITQRDIRDIKSPASKMQDDTDSESVPNMLPPKKCEFAESYLQDYYRHWIPWGVDLLSWCISDSNVRCSSDNNSQITLNQGGDGSKSCPNILEDYQTSNIVSTCTSSCSRCFAFDEGCKMKDKPKKDKPNFLNKILKKTFGATPDGIRVSPKDSLEVFRKRRLYACSNKSNWNACQEFGEVPTSGDCLKTPMKPKKACQKHVSIPDCETMECRKHSCGRLVSSGCATCNETSACQLPIRSRPVSPCPSAPSPPSPFPPPPCMRKPAHDIKCSTPPCLPSVLKSLPCNTPPRAQSPCKTPPCRTPPCKLPPCSNPCLPPRCIRKPHRPPPCISPPCKTPSPCNTPPPCRSPPPCKTPPPCNTPPPCSPPPPCSSLPKCAPLPPCSPPPKCFPPPPCSPPPKCGPSPPCSRMPPCRPPPCKTPSCVSLTPSCNPPPCKPKPPPPPPPSCKNNFTSQSPSPKCVTPPCRTPPCVTPPRVRSKSNIGSQCQTPSTQSCTQCMPPCPSSVQRSGIKLQSLPQKKKSREKDCIPNCANRKKVNKMLSPHNLQKPPQGGAQNRQCPARCMSCTRNDNLDIIRLNSKENLTINLKNRTPSTEEIREGLNIKVQDEDGCTLYERVDYRKYSDKQRERGTAPDTNLIQNLYRDSRIHRVSTTTCVNDVLLEKQHSDNARSCSSLCNMIQINFTLKLKNCDKAAEININNCGDYPKVENTTETKPDRPNKIYMVQKDEGKKSGENINVDKNDVNITILIKDCKQNDEKKMKCIHAHDTLSKPTDVFSEKISQKFNTVATGYSEFNVDNQSFDVHTAIDISNSIKQTKSVTQQSKQLLSEDYLRTDELILTESCLSTAEQTVTDNTVSSINNNLDYENKTFLSDKCSKDDSFKNITDLTTDKSETGVSYTDEEKVVKVDSDKIISGNKEVKQRHTRKEKKEMLKKLFEKAASVKTKNKEAVRTMRHMLQSILTSDSSGQEEPSDTGNELLKELTYESLKPNYFRDTDSMTNYYNLDSTISEEKVVPEQNEEAVYPTKENSCLHSQSVIEESETPRTCMCSALAARLNVRTGEARGCCCRASPKKDEVTSCDLKNKISRNTIAKSCIGIQTQDNRKFKTVIATNVSTIVQIKSKESNDDYYKGCGFGKICPRSIQTCIMHEMSKKMLLQLSEGDRVLNRESNRNIVNSSMRMDSTTVLPNALQTNETKKAVLEIYTEKILSGEGTHLVAKLPKYVISRESEIYEYFDVNKKRVIQKDAVTMEISG